MKIVGKLLVFFSGLLVGLFLSYLTLGIVLSDDSVLSIIMIVIILFYWISWLIVLIKTKQRLYFIALSLFVGFIIFGGYLSLLFSEFSELTLIVGFIFLAYIGMLLISISKKRKKSDIEIES